jgi:hypothetical protein
MPDQLLLADYVAGKILLVGLTMSGVNELEPHLSEYQHPLYVNYPGGFVPFRR